jgi:asparagine synthase (glutamine-hydrolysing)
MFAFIVYDRQERSITCVRDAFGIKPLFYSLQDGNLYCASELPALLSLIPGKPAPDLQRSYEYLVHAVYDNSEHSFIRDVQQLRPGHLLTVQLDSRLESDVSRWWAPSIQKTSDCSFAEASEMVREAFLQNIRLHLRSDVPLGAALSGGVDSSSIVCAMRYVQPDLPIHTFSFIAKGHPVSEEAWIDVVNSHVHAEPHKVFAQQSELMTDLDDMVLAQGEPFGSTSVYAQYRVYRLAREQGMTVMLDGQGADELLAGYGGYSGYRLLSLLSEKRLMEAVRFLRHWKRWPGRSYRSTALEVARVLFSDQFYEAARSVSGRRFAPDWLKGDMLADAGVKFRERRRRLDSANRGRKVIEQLAYQLQERGIPMLLRHGDRNSMRFSIESRVPFLTTDLCDLLFSLPEDYLISGEGETKSVFRAAMRGIVPDQILDRRDKIGFATPEEAWFREAAPKLREWLADSDIVPFLDKAALIRRFDAIMSGQVSFSWQVWRWVNYVRWYGHFIDQ